MKTLKGTIDSVSGLEKLIEQNVAELDVYLDDILHLGPTDHRRDIHDRQKILQGLCRIFDSTVDDITAKVAAIKRRAHQKINAVEKTFDIRRNVNKLPNLGNEDIVPDDDREYQVLWRESLDFLGLYVKEKTPIIIRSFGLQAAPHAANLSWDKDEFKFGRTLAVVHGYHIRFNHIDLPPKLNEIVQKYAYLLDTEGWAGPVWEDEDKAREKISVQQRQIHAAREEIEHKLQVMRTEYEANQKALGQLVEAALSKYFTPISTSPVPLVTGELASSTVATS